MASKLPETAFCSVEGSVPGIYFNQQQLHPVYPYNIHAHMYTQNHTEKATGSARPVQMLICKKGCSLASALDAKIFTSGLAILFLATSAYEAILWGGIFLWKTHRPRKLREL